MGIPRIFVVRESGHRIHNPIDEVKLATLGRALRLTPGQSLLDLACGSGELLCTWARAHGIRGLGVDIEPAFLAAARARAVELGVEDDVDFVEADAGTYAAAQLFDIAACIGASWIGDGVDGTLDLLRRALAPGGLILLGEPYWRIPPPDEETARACHAEAIADFRSLPGLLEHLAGLGYDVVEMMLADQDSWDRYAAAQWLTLRTFLDAHPEDELADRIRAELRTGPARHARYQREHLGWGVFALRPAS